MELYNELAFKRHEKVYNCPICNDRGFEIIDTVDDDGNKHSYCIPCTCRSRAKNEKEKEKAGLVGLFEKCTFANYKTTNDEQKYAVSKTVEFYQKYKDDKFELKPTGLIISGNVGSGKTHLAVACLNNFNAIGKTILYAQYQELVRRLSQSAMDYQLYNVEIDKCIDVDVLLIDDLYKIANKDNISAAQLKYTYEIINKRYVANKTTIITSEKSIDEIMGIDEAIGSRLYEMANREYIVHFKDTKNYRIGA